MAAGTLSQLSSVDVSASDKNKTAPIAPSSKRKEIDEPEFMDLSGIDWEPFPTLKV
jgi:hypothetical protein